MAYVFISYSRHDQIYARQVAESLVAQGFDVWIDDQIDYGDNWERTIFHAIDNCAAFLVIMSPDAYASDWVQRECHYAEKRKKPSFPLLLEGEEFPRYGLTQYIDVTNRQLPSPEFYARLAKASVRGVMRGTDIRAAEGTIPSETERGAGTNPIEPYSIKANVTVTAMQQTWLDLISNPATSRGDRAKAGRELNTLGDPRRGTGLRADGIPDIDWVKIPAGAFLYQSNQTISLPTYYISRFPITYAQFQPFLKEADGYQKGGWWSGLSIRQEQPGNQAFPVNNLPREMISWYDAMAFCRWLSARLNYTIRLPTDREWEKAARGVDGREYPWGNEFGEGRANLKDGSATAQPIMMTSAVGVFTQGGSPYGVLDMAGNVWEWCLNPFHAPDEEALDDMEPRILRGGSWHNPATAGKTWNRAPGDADGRTSLVGFRIVRSAPTQP